MSHQTSQRQIGGYSAVRAKTMTWLSVMFIDAICISASKALLSNMSSKEPTSKTLLSNGQHTPKTTSILL